MKLSQSVAYAVQATLLLAEAETDSPISCSRLAADGGMPERFLLQILRDLAKQGILQSARGGGGGFMLNRDPAEVSLLNLIEAIDGPLLAGLPVRGGFPEQAWVRLREALNRINSDARRHLDALKLTDLMCGKTT